MPTIVFASDMLQFHGAVFHVQVNGRWLRLPSLKEDTKGPPAEDLVKDASFRSSVAVTFASDPEAGVSVHVAVACWDSTAGNDVRISTLIQPLWLGYGRAGARWAVHVISLTRLSQPNRQETPSQPGAKVHPQLPVTPEFKLLQFRNWIPKDLLILRSDMHRMLAPTEKRHGVLHRR
jgi:hypothetical protein